MKKKRIVRKKMINAVAVFLFLILVAIVNTGCGEDGLPPPPPSDDGTVTITGGSV